MSSENVCEHGVIDKPVKLDILNEIPAHFIHEIKTIAYDVSDVNVFLPTLMRILPEKGVNFIPPILLPIIFSRFHSLLYALSLVLH